MKTTKQRHKIGIVDQHVQAEHDRGNDDNNDDDLCNTLMGGIIGLFHMNALG